ncbi:MAG: VCBS repeat-containing protein, partial [Planctomycetota bacterium]
IFVSARWGPTQLLRNKGDGTFEDVTKGSGLEFYGLVNCSVFVDIDNDGDPDAIIGRSLEPVVYFMNYGGKFTDVTDSHSDLSRLFMVSGISVADINRDGLLDFYLSTYGPSGVNERLIIDRGDGGTRFLTEEQRRTLSQLHLNEHGFVDHAGPPNVIVMNRGEGRLEAAANNDLIAQWHHSYQSAWADVDNDGDDDLYIANDFAQDGFLLNETPQGADQPVFRDGLETAFPGGGTGFGMGASWGDFDSDGDLDLYVSNMYSKAGSRILKSIGESDPRFEIATRGNFLYVNENGKFSNRTGTGNGQFNIGKVGWSYGGQFVDFDNNGHLDVYVPSGYFTAVEAADTNVDI